MPNTPNNATHGASSEALSFSTTPRNIMQFTTHNDDPSLDSSGSSLQGHVKAKYNELVDLFGQPTDGDGYKVDAHWVIKFSDGSLSTIYNWKDGKNYNGDDGLPTQQITEWHIGGMSRRAADRVQIAIDLYRETKEAMKKKDKVEEAFTSAMEMMEMLKATKGKHYAETVELTMIMKKLGDLQHILLLSLVETDVMPPEVAKALTKIQAQMTSRVISLMFRSNGSEPSKPEATELMEWADRLMECEQDGISELVKSFPKRDNK